ncbi:DUF4302 domain-containing protein [uncultured Prevotella sp.]|uniref:DUF4302 domain-containing protein n=1 Tax=uncultured Prevotella sp. TaxID=159272 RepID=UPI0026195C63|nr:DUF4302 domain-containing protein [uncultured Prevotella sp.]
MNKIFSIALLCSAALSFTACVNEEDDLFDKTAAERLNEASSLYSQRLTASPNGWAVQLYPTTQNEAPYGTGYLLMFRFHANKSVDASMNNLLSNGKYLSATSSWDVITDNGPVLSFDTYNPVVHAFSDPEDVPQTGDRDNTIDETGTGIGGDFEFIIVDAPEDASYMMLKGKKRGTYNLLTPVEEGVDFEAYLSDVKSFQSKMFPSTQPSFDVLHIGGDRYRMIDYAGGVPNIYPYDGDAVMDQTFNPFLITKRGDDYYLRFRDAKKYGEYTVQDFKYDKEKDIFQSVDNADCYIDGDEPLRFFNQRISVDKRRLSVSVKAPGVSDKVAECMSSISNEFKSINKKYALRAMFLYYDNSVEKYYLRVQYGSDNFAEYEFAYSENEGNAKFEYVQPKSDSDANVLSGIPSLKTFIQNLSNQFVVSAVDTKFDMSNLKFVSAADAAWWFNMTL